VVRSSGPPERPGNSSGDAVAGRAASHSRKVRRMSGWSGMSRLRYPLPTTCTTPRRSLSSSCSSSRRASSSTRRPVAASRSRYREPSRADGPTGAGAEARSSAARLESADRSPGPRCPPSGWSAPGRLPGPIGRRSRGRCSGGAAWPEPCLRRARSRGTRGRRLDGHRRGTGSRLHGRFAGGRRRLQRVSEWHRGPGGSQPRTTCRKVARPRAQGRAEAAEVAEARAPTWARRFRPPGAVALRRSSTTD